MGFEMRINFVDVVCDESLKNTYVNGKKNGYKFDIRLSYYRGLYLSCIDEFEVVVDGEKVDADDIIFCINDKEFNVYQLSYCISEFWSLVEPAKILVNRKGGLSAGEHNVEIKLMLRVPYLPMPGGEGEHNYAALNSCGEKTLMIVEDNARGEDNNEQY